MMNMDSAATTIAPAKAVPLADPDTAPYWAGLRRHQLLIQQCTGCARLRWPARALCHGCQSWDCEWVAVSGRGELVTWSVMHHALSLAFASDVPYTIGMVRLAERDDVVVMGPVVACDPSELRIGDAVEVAFDDREDDVTVLQWVPRPPRER